MFSVEMTDKTSVITVVCEDTLYPDLKTVIGDYEVFISQHCEDTDTTNVIRISNRMFAEFLLSIEQKAGVYNTELGK